LRLLFPNQIHSFSNHMFLSQIFYFILYCIVVTIFLIRHLNMVSFLIVCCLILYYFHQCLSFFLRIQKKIKKLIILNIFSLVLLLSYFINSWIFGIYSILTLEVGATFFILVNCHNIFFGKILKILLLKIVNDFIIIYYFKI
jgi:hypothetical protein